MRQVSHQLLLLFPALLATHVEAAGSCVTTVAMYVVSQTIHKCQHHQTVLRHQLRSRKVMLARTALSIRKTCKCISQHDQTEMFREVERTHIVRSFTSLVLSSQA